jgi:hypothetical protein
MKRCREVAVVGKPVRFKTSILRGFAEFLLRFHPV